MTDESRNSEHSSSVLIIPSDLNFLAPTAFDSLTRVGRTNDGGYVVPEFLIKESNFLISLGLSDDWSFDIHFKTLNPNIQIHAYDHTISRADYLVSLQKSIIKACVGKLPLREVARRFALLRTYDSFFAGPAKHFRERVHSQVTRPGDVTLEEIFKRTSSWKVFLKVDIEGSEYRIIDDILRYADRVIGMAIEFHDTGPLRPVFSVSVQRLQERFEIAHLHANNFGGVAQDGLPEALEMTFVNKSRCKMGKKRTDLPISPVDSPCNPRVADYKVRFIV